MLARAAPRACSTASARLGVHTPNRSGFPIVEIPLRDHDRIDAVGQMLFDRGVYVTLAAYPLVPKDEVGFRVQLTAANTDAEIDMLIAALEELAERGELQPAAQRRAAWLGGGGLSHARRARTPARSPLWQLLPRRRRAAVRALRVGAAVRGQRPGLQPARALAGRGDRRRRPPLPPGVARAVALVRASGCLLFWLGDLYTYSYPRLFGADVPFPSLGDGAYVAVYPALMAGLLMLVRRRNPERDRAGRHRLADHDARAWRCSRGSR